MVDLKTKIIDGEKDVKETLAKTKLWERKNPEVSIKDIKIFFLVKNKKQNGSESRIVDKNSVYRARIKYSV